MVELYENVVLDFDEMIVIFFRWVWRFILNVVIVVVEDFSIWIVRTGVIYLLEVIWIEFFVIFFIVDMNNVVSRNVDFFILNIKGFVIGFINCD